MKPAKPKPYQPGLVRGQLPRSPLREATNVEITYRPIEPTRYLLEYPNHAETPNEKSRRQLAKSMPRVRIAKSVVQFDIPLGDWIL